MATVTANNQIIKHGLKMRASFSFKNYPVSQWFPGHMNRGVSQVHRRLKEIDCVIEVHDARVPLSGRNPLFEKEISQIKPHLLVFNKVDLINKSEAKTIIKEFEKQNKNVIFTNCKNEHCQGMKKLIPKAIDLIKNSVRYHRESSNDYNVMIMGIPNVGKSSLINALRVKYLHKGGKATQVGATPGITRSVLEKIKICENPLIYVRDTPGILEPKIQKVETGLKLALANTIKDHLVGEEVTADYLLFRMNLIGNHKYVEALELNEPSDDIQRVLGYFAVKKDMILKKRDFVSGGFSTVPDIHRAALHFLTIYRAGKLGSLNLDFES